MKNYSQNQDTFEDLGGDGLTVASNVEPAQDEWINEIVADLSIGECENIIAYVCSLRNQYNSTHHDFPFRQAPK